MVLSAQDNQKNWIWKKQTSLVFEDAPSVDFWDTHFFHNNSRWIADTAD